MSTRPPVHVSEAEMAVQRDSMCRIAEMPHRPQTYHVVTYGCQMNAHDSEKLAGMLEQMGLTAAPDREEADFVIFNTCCVRDNAERRALGNVTWLKEIRKVRPEMMIAVCGCMIQEPGMAERILKQYPFVDLAFGTANLHRFPSLFERVLTDRQRVVSIDGDDVIAEDVPVRRLRGDAAYLTIMYGCDNFCSYCIVPYVRGRERSRRMADILREAEALRDTGVKEIMLLGQNVNSYRGEDGEGFPQLLRAVDALGIERIRFMTSHPKDLSDDLIAAMAECEHVLPQFHLPVQAGNDDILRRMNRRYTRAEYLDKVRRLREAVPGIGLTTDIIVGFPGETEAQFADTLSLVDEVGYDSAFTFIYSPRTGTAAAKMPDQIPAEVSTERIQRLIALQEKRQREQMTRFVGQEEKVLVEGLSRRSDRQVSGKGGHGISVTFPGNEKDIGQIVPVRITGLKNNTLSAERKES
ncbi:MAG: tRNA (N6-isopentenyl adenosine(37)-C2)-methylthiotransferase MiaB [Clostridia bacterium]|nr:tRNA (N6-isopentenyl adenosine(37)-C2)-methylthiotransferase MiaB [Clostridia bacterium]